MDTRKCIRCKQDKPLSDFKETKSPFFPAHRSLICTSCYEKMVPQDDLNAVDRLCRFLDIPFDLNKWTQLYAIHGEHTLTAYFNLLLDGHYQAMDWRDENERWKAAREEATIEDEMEVLSAAKLRALRADWSSAYTNEELLFLENFYNEILASQNVSTPILQSRARTLCELTLRVQKGIREGADVKKDMDAIDNIVKTCGFTAANAKNNANFESVGELMVYFGKLGWHPKYHNEPQDSIDFMMENIQHYLKRLVTNEGNFIDQVEDKRARYNMVERLETVENEAVEFEDDADIDYEGEEEFADEFRD